MKLGIAIAANRPIMATTIMISTSVKPLLREVLVCIFLVFLLSRREHSSKRIIIITISVHVLLVANRADECISLGPGIKGKGHFLLSDLDPADLSVVMRTQDWNSANSKNGIVRPATMDVGMSKSNGPGISSRAVSKNAN